MHVLVTGAAGLYGVHLVHQLLERPEIEHVTGLDNFKRKYAVMPPFLDKDMENPRFSLMPGDFQGLTAQKLDRQEFDAVIHAAAYICVPESMESPEKRMAYVMNNEVGTFELVTALQETREQPLFIFCSSGKVYGEPMYTPIDTEHPKNPANVYGTTKLNAENHCMMAHRTSGYPVVIVRNFNTFGENQNLFTDAAVISNFIALALRGEPLTVHGDGEQTRDFTYVRDAADAYVRLCLSGKEHVGKVFNMGSGRETSINELAETIISTTNSRSMIVHERQELSDTLKAGALVKMRADNSLLVNAVGWAPQYSLEEGVALTARWYEQVLSKG